MKKLMIAAALVAATFSSALAGDNKKADNNEIRANHKALTGKTAELEADVKRHDNSAAESAAMDVLALMRQGVGAVSRTAGALSEADRPARLKQVSEMESLVHDYIDMTRDVPSNAQRLVDQARTFLNKY